MIVDDSIAQPQSASEAEAMYHVPAWGEAFFGVNEQGHVAVRPKLEAGEEIDLYAVVEELAARDIAFPVTLRFPNLLGTRVRQLNEAFLVAMEETDYAAGYMGVYPMKVNQIRQVVEGILGEDEASIFGLEAGSKAELIASLPYLTNSKRLLICNGYKSAEMIELMLAFQRLGRNVMPIVEKDREFEAILAEAKQHEATPRFGMRVRLSAAGAGQWSESSGDDSKFGISMPDLLSLVQRLEDANLYDALCLLHFHLGSQIDSIQALKMAVKEITRIYVSLYRRGHRITYLDAGGGLGVNYNAAPLSGGNGGVDYSIQEYANVIVYAVKEVCDAENVPVPTLVAENGRAIAAHHSVLIVEAVSSTSKPTATLGFVTSEEDHEVIRLLYQMATEMRPSNGQAHNLGRLLEAYHDAVEERHNAETLFAYGYLSLEEKALAERLYWTICEGINDRIHAAKPDHLPSELESLDEHLVDQVLCDFSVFQSLTDHWSIGQRFPIMPIHRLDEVPTRRSRLVDLTCDCYGTISHFISPNGSADYLNLHPILPGERYFLGIFLTGAYQDSLSDHHNLFGTVTEAYVAEDEAAPGGFSISEIIPGMRVTDMLERVRYDPQHLFETVDGLVRARVAEGRVSREEGAETLARFRAMMDGFTYLESES